MNFLSGLQDRAHRVLVGDQPGGGRAGRTAEQSDEAATAWRTGRPKEFAARGRRTAPGKLFGPDGCSHEARGAKPCPRQDSRQAKDAGGELARMERWSTRHPRKKAAPACALMPARSGPERLAGTLPAPDGKRVEAWRGVFIARLCGVSVNRPSWCNWRPTVSIVDGTHLHNLPQQGAAQSSTRPPWRGLYLGKCIARAGPTWADSACRFNAPPRRRGAFLVFGVACRL